MGKSAEIKGLFNEVADVFNKNVAIKKERERLDRLIYGLQPDELRELEEYTNEYRNELTEKAYVYLMSCYMRLFEDNEHIIKLLEYTIDSKELFIEEKYFILFQVRRFIFTREKNKQVSGLCSRLYDQIYYTYCEELKDEFVKIPKEERNEKLIIFFTSQFLTLNHGPTKTILDRSLALAKSGKLPFIINTCELGAEGGELPFFNMYISSYIEQYEQYESIAYEDERFTFFQCGRNMPNIKSIRELIAIVKQLKPYCIFCCGGSIISDLCSNVITSININTVPSALSDVRSTFQAIGRSVTDEDIEWLCATGRRKDHIIESAFTWSFKPQTTHYSRAAFNIPDDRKAGIVIGARLTEEVNKKFIDILSPAFEDGLFLVFAGNLTNYDQLCDECEGLRENSVYVGYISDILALCEICDLYINPKRKGGGGSVVEAMAKGLPFAALRYGDVGIAVGDMGLEEYEDIGKEVRKLITDKAYYEEMSKKAYERSKVLQDTRGQFMKILEEASNREGF